MRGNEQTFRCLDFYTCRQDSGSASLPAGVQQGIDGQAGAPSGEEGEKGKNFVEKSKLQKINL